MLDPHDPFLETAIRNMINERTGPLAILIRQLQAGGGGGVGPAGPAGPTGPTGPTGATGPAGTTSFSRLFLNMGA